MCVVFFNVFGMTFVDKFKYSRRYSMFLFVKY